MELKPIGMVHSPYKTKEDVPHRGIGSVMGEIEVFNEYEDGLKDIDGFSHLIVLWICHKSWDIRFIRWHYG